MRRVSRAFRNGVLGATVAAALGTTACVVPVPSPMGRAPADTPGATPIDPDDMSVSAELVEAHNRVRAARRLPPLSVSGPLEAAAREHARDMARRQWMSHRGGDGSSPFRRMANQGYTFRRAGENVAAGHRSVDAVMSGWMRSPGHRRNILGNFREIGAACANDAKGTTYWCVTFGEPAAR
jgi:uncharacterized protein YkwD